MKLVDTVKNVLEINKEFEKFIKEDKIEEAFWKIDIPDMPPIFVEAGSAAEIKASMRKKLKTAVVKELVIDRVSKAEMVKKYRELAKGKGDGDDDSEVKEDDDPDTPGTQGDKAEYQKKRKAVAKKFGVGDCSQLSGAKKKACYTALDKAHVADHEEQVELKNMRKEDTQKSFSKVFSNLKNIMKEKKKKGNPHY